MKSHLETVSDVVWHDGDSAWHGDYLGGRLSEHGIARIYEVASGYVVHLRFHCQSADMLERLLNDEARLLGMILPAVSAESLRVTDPLD